MVKLTKKFVTGDKVFAKVRGYPPWPARVEKISDPNSKNARYNVYFYGTGETAVCKVEELYSYAENKAKFCKPSRRKFFHEGIQQLEQELKNDRSKPLADIAAIKVKSAVTEDALSKGNDATVLPTVSAADSDMESGSLVIDEGEKKKPLKRKAFSSTSNTPDTPEVKKKRGRGKTSNDTSKQEAALDSQGEESPKEVVSRSGRKIKPKRFADFSSSEETEINTEKNEHSGRGRKPKSEDSNQVSSNVIHKKRAALEKRNSVGEGSILDGTVISSAASSDAPSRVLLARTFAGEHVGIRLDMDRPKTFESERARTQWDWSTARNAMKLKAQLESGEILPEQVKDSLDFNVPVSEDEKRVSAKDGVHRKTYKLRWLRTEAQLLQLDAQIKSNLGLDRANTDKCLQAMDDILALSIDPLMLKKHPHIVETVKRLRRYIGNLGEWKLNEEEGTVFKQKAEQIRQKAEHIYNKYKAMFTIPEGQSFWQSFSNQVVHFKELTKNMSEEKVFSLMSDPACQPDVDAGRSVDSPANDSGNQLEADAAAADETEPAAEPEAQAGAEPEPEAEAELELEPAAEPEAEAKTNVESESKSEPKAGAEAKTVERAQTATETKSESVVEAEVAAEVPTRSGSPKEKEEVK